MATATYFILRSLRITRIISQERRLTTTPNSFLLVLRTMPAFHRTPCYFILKAGSHPLPAHAQNLTVPLLSVWPLGIIPLATVGRVGFGPTISDLGNLRSSS